MTDKNQPTAAPVHKNQQGRNAALVTIAILATIAAFKISVVSVGNSSAGHTAIIWKDEGTSSLRLFDSAKAACQRQGQSSYLCEGALALAIQGRSLRLVKLPYIGAYASLVGGH